MAVPGPGRSSSTGRINRVKWDVIYKLEDRLPAKPFQNEKQLLGTRSLSLPKLELAIPLTLGLGFLVLAALPQGGRTHCMGAVRNRLSSRRVV